MDSHTTSSAEGQHIARRGEKTQFGTMELESEMVYAETSRNWQEKGRRKKLSREQAGAVEV